MKSTAKDIQTSMESNEEAMNLHLHIVGIFLHLMKAYDILNNNAFLKNLILMVSEIT